MKPAHYEALLADYSKEVNQLRAENESLKVEISCHENVVEAWRKENEKLRAENEWQIERNKGNTACHTEEMAALKSRFDEAVGIIERLSEYVEWNSRKFRLEMGTPNSGAPDEARQFLASLKDIK